MRVAILSHNTRARDAVGNHVAALASLFLERGADVRVFVETKQNLHSDLTGLAHVGVVHLQGAAWEYLCECDLVIAQYAQVYDLLHYLPMLVGKRPRILFDYLGISPADAWPPAQRHLLRQSALGRNLAWCADAVLTISDFAARELMAATRLPASRIHVLGLPVSDSFKLADVPGSRANVRKRLGVPLDAPMLMCVGRLAVNKRLPVLIEALKDLHDWTCQPHVVHVGDAGDVYSEELNRCLELAQELGVADRFHHVPSVNDETLAEIYRAADLFVMPSIHEGFCVPVIEAMASGLPVLTARSSALPQTVGDAGLTFIADDSRDLAKQIRRIVAFAPHSFELQLRLVAPVFPTPPGTPRGEGRVRGDSDPRYGIEFMAGRTPPHPLSPEVPVERGARAQQKSGENRDCLSSAQGSPLRIAVVSFRFGNDIVGGAERSLGTIARALKKGGHSVEIFTTCTRHESNWHNELPAGTFEEDGLTISRFPIDPHDRALHLKSLEALNQAGAKGSTQEEAIYLRHSIHSAALVHELRRREPDLDAIIVGPYLFGLTCDVATAFASKTLVLPCLHTEPLARLSAWPRAYGNSAGLLYHTPEEQTLAQTELGFNHPNSHVIGTWLKGNPCLRGGLWGSRPYVVYCGRYSREKELPRLLEYMADYQESRPMRIDLLLMGQGDVPLPRADWLHDLGRVEEDRKQQILAGALALVQLSRQESLSIVVLEAWAQGIPVIVDSQCPVLVGQAKRAGGGYIVDDFASFEHALDELCSNSERGKALGECGRVYVEKNYLTESVFADRLVQAITNVSRPIADLMRERGLAQAEQCRVPQWRAALSEMIDGVLDQESREVRREATICCKQRQLEANVGQRSMLLALRLRNDGTHPLANAGPGRSVIVACIDEGPANTTPLPELLAPDAEIAAAVVVLLPSEPGEYQVKVWLTCEHDGWQSDPLNVALAVGQGRVTQQNFALPNFAQMQESLVELHQLTRLPDDYMDVTTGWFAGAKRWLKRKMLGNFKRGYVDVLSRQQSQVNERLSQCVNELAECCATLDHAVRQMQGRLAEKKVEDSTREALPMQESDV